MKKLPKKFSREKKDVFTYKHEKQIQGVPDQNLLFQMAITQKFAILTFYYFPFCKMVFNLVSNENNLTLTNEYVKFCNKQGDIWGTL